MYCLVLKLLQDDRQTMQLGFGPENCLGPHSHLTELRHCRWECGSEISGPQLASGVWSWSGSGPVTLALPQVQVLGPFPAQPTGANIVPGAQRAVDPITGPWSAESCRPNHRSLEHRELSTQSQVPGAQRAVDPITGPWSTESCRPNHRSLEHRELSNQSNSHEG